MAVATHVMKKFINDPADVVKESLAGLAAAHPDLVRVDFESQIVVRKDALTGKVAIISGGGSGHEPMHGGFVGAGMLDAACPERSSPARSRPDARSHEGRGRGRRRRPHRQELHGRRHELQARRRTGRGRGHRGRVDPDERRRGGGGQPLHRRPPRCRGHGAGGEDRGREGGGRRLAGRGGGGRAQGEREWPQLRRRLHLRLDSFVADPDVRDRRRRDGVRGGDSRRAGASPREGQASPRRSWPRWPRRSSATSGPSGSNVLAFVNGLGGTPTIELYVIYNELAKQLEERGLTATRSLVGDYITSLEMAGASITLLKLDDELTELWDAPVHTPALRWGR